MGDLTMKICKSIFWLSALPKPGDPAGLGNTYRTLDQLSPGASAFAARFGTRSQF